MRSGRISKISNMHETSIFNKIINDNKLLIFIIYSLIRLNYTGKLWPQLLDVAETNFFYRKDMIRLYKLLTQEDIILI